MQLGLQLWFIKRAAHAYYVASITSVALGGIGEIFLFLLLLHWLIFITIIAIIIV